MASPAALAMNMRTMTPALCVNANPSATPLGTPTGRGIDGKQNGALGVDDIMEIMAYMQQRGYNIDTVLIHPFAYMAWCRDPEIRETILGAGGAPVLVHCASANRAGGLLALMAASEEGMDKEAALEFGRDAGMKSTEARVREVLSQD